MRCDRRAVFYRVCVCQAWYGILYDTQNTFEESIISYMETSYMGKKKVQQYHMYKLCTDVMYTSRIHFCLPYVCKYVHI